MINYRKFYCLIKKYFSATYLLAYQKDTLGSIDKKSYCCLIEIKSFKIVFFLKSELLESEFKNIAKIKVLKKDEVY